MNIYICGHRNYAILTRFLINYTYIHILSDYSFSYFENINLNK